ncbi:MAG: nucleotide exchange factor GrpE [Desulfobacterales bacterium]|nr:nucleotide exchange factor GrpE [Desulfobacterales bacterium]
MSDIKEVTADDIEEKQDVTIPDDNSELSEDRSSSGRAAYEESFAVPYEELAQKNNEDIVIIMDKLDSLNDQFNTQINQVISEFNDKIKYDAHKDKIIDDLHKELQDYKNNLVKSHFKSTILDLIKIIDDIRKMISYYKDHEATPEESIKLLSFVESIPPDLENIISWLGVESFISEGNFDASKQRILKKIEIDDKLKDKTIAESLRPGYEWEGKVIRPEMVAVYQYKDKEI